MPQAVPSSPAPRRSWLRRLVRAVLILSLLVVLALATVLGLVLGTESGLRTTLALADRLAPEMVEVQTLEGRLLGPLQVEGFALHLPSVDVRVRHLELDWQPSRLFAATLAIDRLIGDGIEVELGPSEEKKSEEPLTLPDLRLPLQVEVGEVQITNLRVAEQGSDTPLVDLDHARLVAALDEGDLSLTHLDAALRTPVLEAHAEGHAMLSGDYPLELTLDSALTLDPAAALQAQVRLQGDLQRLVVQAGVSGAVTAKLEATLEQVLDALRWNGTVTLEKVDLPAFQADLPSVDLGAKLTTQGNLQQANVQGTLDARAPDLPDFGHLAAQLDLRWQDQVLALRTLHLTEQVSGAEFDASGRLGLDTQPGTVRFSGTWKQLRWPLSGELLAQATHGSVSVDGTLEDFRYALAADVLGPDLPELSLAAQGQGSTQETHLEKLTLHTLDGQMQAQGKVRWAPDLHWQVQCEGDGLDLQGVVAGLAERVGFQLTSEGGLDGFDYGLSANLKGDSLPPSSLVLKGTGDQHQTKVETLHVETLKGTIDGQASVGFDAPLQWDAKLAVAGIDPGAFAAEWPGTIAAQLRSQGRLAASGPDFTAVLENLDGTLRGYPLAASGTVSMQDGALRIESFKAASGTTSAQASGTLGQTLDLAFSVHSPNLATLLPGAKGSLKLDGALSGTAQSPLVKADLDARDAEWNGQGIARLSGRLQAGLASDAPIVITLDGANLVAGSQRWSTLQVRGDGTTGAHNLRLDLKGDDLSLALAEAGGLDAKMAYQGKLSRLDLVTADFGSWHLQSPVPLAYETSHILFGPLCLNGKEGSKGCARFEQTAPGSWVATADLQPLSFALLEGMIPDNVEAEGGVQVQARFEARNGALLGHAEARIPKGRLNAQLAAGKEETLDFSSSVLRVDATAQGLAAKLQVPVRGIGEVAGDVSLPGWSLSAPAGATQSLRGGVRMRLNSLERLANLVPDLTAVTGSMGANLNLGGTLTSPDVSGDVRIEKVGFEVPLTGLKVKNFDLALTLASLARQQLRGQADVGGSPLVIDGAGGWRPDGTFQATVKTSGQSLKVADTKEYFARVSPQFEISATEKGATIQGQLTVPEARIRPRSLPAGTVSPSADVVMAGSVESAPYPVAIDVALVLGKDVSIDTFGVNGRLSGKLRVLQEPGKDMMGDGQLQILDGTYRFSGGFGVLAEIGTALDITQGRLIYAKSPIENPGLLLQAQRDGGDTSAGVRVLGTLREPKMAFFSESDPGMTQAQITKYLLTGIAPDESSSSSDSSLAVGTYVAPRIYMEYESGLSDESNAVKLRYDLTRHVEIQTETGESQGADVYFTFEH